MPAHSRPLAVLLAAGVALAIAGCGGAAKTTKTTQTTSTGASPLPNVPTVPLSSLPLAPLSTLGKLTPAPNPGKVGPEDVPVPISEYLLAPPQSVHLGETIDGVTCQRIERLEYHIHDHLTIFVDGKARIVPDGIGIGKINFGSGPPTWGGINTAEGPFITLGSCFMWLHTHALDGIIHIESPTEHTYTLGQFFAVWGIPLSKTQLGPYKGKVTTFYDGEVWTGNPDDIPLTSEIQVQIDVGTPIIAPEHITFPPGLAPSTSTAAMSTPSTPTKTS